MKFYEFTVSRKQESKVCISIPDNINMNKIQMREYIHNNIDEIINHVIEEDDWKDVFISMDIHSLDKVDSTACPIFEFDADWLDA